MDALEHNDVSSFDFVHFVGSHMQREVVIRELDILAIQEHCNLFVGEVKVESLRMIEVVISCVFVLLN
jgi:hypothetical protein